MTDTRDVWMMDLRGRPRFAQETRSDSGHLRDLSVYDFQGDQRIQNSIARAIRDCHGTGTELNWKSVGTDFHFKVIVSQPAGCKSTSVLL
jgi:hypothetical protein